MRLLSVAERELRAASRRPGTYRVRWISASGFFLLLFWMAWAFDLFKNRNAGLEVFGAASASIFFYCLLVGAAATADCISREKREGTLGLLFLTNLNSREIIIGKIFSNGLVLFYSLLAIFPVLALPMLIGGISSAQLGRTILALVNGLLFGIASGFIASAVSIRQFPAVALAMSLALVFGVGPVGIAAAIPKTNYLKIFAEGVAVFSPLKTLLIANESPGAFKPFQFWRSLGAVAATSFTAFVFVSFWVGRNWRDRPITVPFWRRINLGATIRERAANSRRLFRRRLLEINPLFWLGGRQRISAPIFMLVTVILFVFTTTITIPFFSRVVGAGPISPLVGNLIGWLCFLGAIHLLVLYYAATVGSQRTAEDKQSGALELILSTPTSVSTIARGLWLAYGRKMFFPILIATLAHGFFIWNCLVTFLNDPSEFVPRSITPWQFAMSALTSQPFQGFVPEWQFGFMLRIALLILVALMANWLMLGWLGRWLGLRMKHPGFAPIVAVALAIVPPILLFSLLCYVGDQLKLNRMSEREYLPLLMWLGIGISLANCVLLSAWSAKKFRSEFRTMVTNRFDAPSIRSWRPSRKGMLRFATVSASLVLTLGLMVPLFYGCQTWRSERRWADFQNEVKERGESLDYVRLVPSPVADEKNFAKSKIFQKLLSEIHSSDWKVNADLGIDSPAAMIQRCCLSAAAASHGDFPWMKQAYSDFDQQLSLLVLNYKTRSPKDRSLAASAICKTLEPIEKDLAELRKATRLSKFQIDTNNTPQTIFQPEPKEALTVVGLQFVLNLRACALLELSRSTEASDEVFAGLRLAQFARQLTDSGSAERAQAMVARSLQPIWEGLAKHRWNEEQLAEMQNELSTFTLLSDHTNAIHRATLAYIENWSVRARSKTTPTNTQNSSAEINWQPQAWWLDKSIHLYRAAQQSVARIDVANGKVDTEFRWIDISELPLDQPIVQLLQQGFWNVDPASVTFAQTAVNQAIIACALERYRLAHGRYPETLEPLLNQFLSKVPNDVVRGMPMFYRLTPTNSYELRGVGLDGFIARGKLVSDDWVWAYSAVTNLPAANPPRKK